MSMRIVLFILFAVALTACRGNLPRTDEDTRKEEYARTHQPLPVEKIDISSAAKSTEPQQTGSGAYLAGDGPGAGAPSNLDSIPNAVPRAEPLHRYANRPYTVLGKSYTPLTETGNYKKTGIASWYGKKFHGQRTSIGESYDMYGMTAASTTLPVPSYARVTNLENKKSVIVRVNDRGPFLHERIIDLSYTAAAKLGIIGHGQGQVEVESLSADGSPIYKEPMQISALPPVSAVSTGNIYLQLGAFDSPSAAENFLGNMRTKLNDTGKKLSLLQKNGMTKVRIGPYASIDIARETALKLENQLGFKPILSRH